DWRTLDADDADLGGTNPLPLDVPGAGGSAALLLALGKDGRAYLIDRNRLGGIGGSLLSGTVSTGAILTAPATFRIGEEVYVAMRGRAAHCPASSRGNGLTVLQIRAGPPPSVGTAWCGALPGKGAPIVTTTDGRSNPIVWVV